MPQLDDASDRLLHEGQKVKTRASRLWNGFADFALQDNVLEVAVGLMYVYPCVHICFVFIPDFGKNKGAQSCSKWVTTLSLSFPFHFFSILSFKSVHNILRSKFSIPKTLLTNSLSVSQRHLQP